MVPFLGPLCMLDIRRGGDLFEKKTGVPKALVICRIYY